MGTIAPELDRPRLGKTALAGMADKATLAAVTGLLHPDFGKAPESTPSRPLLAPRALVAGRYEVIEQLSEGGMGVVFGAVDRITSEQVALKVVRPEFRKGADLMRFRHEYYLMATLKHPRFVEVRDYALTDDGAPCLVMQYVRGDDLHTLLPLRWPDAARVLYQVCSALAFLHSRRYIHHDIKPSNVRVYRDDRTGQLEARLIDFGIMDPIGTASARGWVGTPAYLPPEALFSAPTDHRLDLYALGVMAFEMLTGNVPFEMKDTESFLVEKQLEPPDVKSTLSHVPDALADLIADLMAPDAADRPFDASVTLRRLRLAAALEVDPSDDEKAPPYLYPSRLVARDEAVDSVLDAWAESLEAPKMLTIVGAAGFGKSAVVREVRLRLRMQAAVTVEVAGGAGSGGFRVLRAIVSHLSPLVRGPLEHKLGALAPELLRAIPELGELFDVQPTRPHADPLEDRRLLFDALRRWFGAIVEAERLAILIDDAHLADAASLDALRALVADTELGGLFVLMTEPGGTVSDSPVGRLAGLGRTLRLEPFEEGDVDELLKALFDPVHPYPRFVKALTEASRGNPSFVIEIVRRLVDDGAIVFTDERWRLPRELDSVPLPTSLADALVHRLDGLGAEARTVVEALGVLGREVPITALAELLEIDEVALFGGLDELVSAELVECRDESYRLSRAVQRDPLLANVDAALRRALHRRFAELAEQRLGPAAPRHASELSLHYRMGGVRDKALEYLALACENLFEAQALADAIEPLQELERLLVESSPSSSNVSDDLLLKTRQRLARVGVALDSDLAVRYFTLERETFLPNGPSPSASFLAERSPLARRLLLSRELARTAAQELVRAVGRPHRLGALPDRVRRYVVATSYLAASLALKGSFAEALDVAESLRAFAITPRSQANGAYNICRSIALVHQGRVTEAEACLLVALDLMDDERLRVGVPEADYNSGLGGILTCLTLLYSARGRPEAGRWLSRFEAFVEEQDQKLRFLMPNLLLAQIDYHLHRGEVLLARHVERRYRAHHAQIGLYNSHVEAQILVGLARVALAARDLVGAESLLSELTRRRPEDFFSHGWGACVSGELWALQRLLGRARDALSEALRYATRSGQRSFKLELRALNALSELELEEGNSIEARRLARQALALAKAPECRSEFEEIWALRTLASIAVVQGEIDVAHRRVEDLHACATGTENPLFSAVAEKARSDVARALGKREDATAYGAQAKQLFERLGYVPITLAPQSQSSLASGSSPRATALDAGGALSNALQSTPSRPRSASA